MRAIILLLALLWPGVTMAQSVDLGGSDQPVEIDAAESLEWHSEEQLYVARGDAVLRQGDTEVRADTLTAHYRELASGDTEIYRVEADGSVVIETPTERAQGDHGVYEVDRDVFVLTGGDLRLDTEDGTITARDSLEYWQGAQRAIARGNAVAVQTAEGGGENRIEADVLTAELAEGPDGSLEIQVIDATGGVTITTPTDVARGREGVYNLQTDIATLTGDVRLTRGQNQLNGDYAEVNLETGVSRLLARPGEGEGRVRGLLVPNDGQSNP
ncbi:MAG TPA: LptA/OstA family protein [Alphaproteobacteria bacterium]|nr:LptA/OstA family protein [Alphaproteobacteria bacterium]